MIIPDSILECCITISDINIIYSKNRNELILNIIKEKYEGKCYASCYIIKINKIIKRSLFNVNTDLNATINVNIQFEAETLVYQINEIIHDCRIIKKETSGIIHGKSKYCGIQLNISQQLSIYEVDNITPVIIKNIRYNISQPEISVSAYPFIPLKNPTIIYNCVIRLSPENLKTIQKSLSKLNDIQLIIDKLNKSDKKIFEFFYELIMVKQYKINKNDTSTNVISLMDKLKLFDNTKTELTENTKNIILYKHENCLDLCVNYETDKHENTITEDIYKVLNLFIYSNIYMNQCLLDFIQYYPTNEIIQKHKNIWKLYLMYKNKKD